jgi:hypothetical protein
MGLSSPHCPNLGSGVVEPLAQVVSKAVAQQASSNFVAARHLAAIGPPWAQNIFLPDLVTMTNHMPGHTTEAAVPFRQNRRIFVIPSLAGKVHFSAKKSWRHISTCKTGTYVYSGYDLSPGHVIPASKFLSADYFRNGYPLARQDVTF